MIHVILDNDKIISTLNSDVYEKWDEIPEHFMYFVYNIKKREMRKVITQKSNCLVIDDKNVMDYPEYAI
jgi:hypothetical protein